MASQNEEPDHKRTQLGAASLPRKKEEKLYPMIVGIATGTPDYCLKQTDNLNIFKLVSTTPKTAGVLDRIFENTKIESRYASIPDFKPEESDEKLFFPPDKSFEVPLEVRLERFKEDAFPLATKVCKEAIEDANVDVEDIGKIIVVSSTGFHSPGLDYELIVQLGLSRELDRTMVGYMGCAAAINGFKVGMDYCVAHPGKKALVVCAELSSIHTTCEDTINNVILRALFTDGCAAAVMEAKYESDIPTGSLVMANEHCCLMEDTKDGITLTMGSNAISCILSKYLSSYILKGITGYVDSWLKRECMTREDVDFWAVHPGGPRVLEAVEKAMNLARDDTANSWAVLAQYGNNISPAIMFVLQRCFKNHWEQRGRGEKGFTCGLAIGFSPGVVFEGIMFKQLN